MIGKKINQLATELAPVSTDLTIIGDPISGVSKKITLAQLGAIFSGAVSFYTNLAGFPATGDINVIYCAKDTQKLYLWSGSAYVEVFPSQALLDTYQLRSEKGVSNGYASLDSSGKVPISQLPSSIMEYKGTWNAATNTPTLANGTGDTGDVYICNVAGTVNFGAGPITFAVGDYVIYSGSIWQRSSGAVGTVTSVAASITGNAIGITGSPVTTSGTLAFAFAGTGAQYIKGDGTLATFPNTISQAEKLITEVYNSTGATLTKGTIVYINGGQGNLPTVTKALATGDSTSAQTFGVVQADITNNNNGYVVVAGKLSDLDTQAYTEGTQLYLSSTTAGAWTSTKQYAPAHLVYVGIVVRAHPTQGIVEIKIQNGYELDELHDVAAQNPDNNDILQYKTSTSLWTKVAGTTSNIAEGSNLYYTDARSRAALSFTAGSGAYNSTTGVITIPTNTNQLTNGAAFITLGSLSAGAGISYNNTTGVIASTITQYTDAMARASISLTTTGTSGAATYNSTTGVLNVPQYAPDLSGYVPTSRTLTINGTAFDLSANRSWSVGTVTSVGLSSATSGVSIGSTPVTTSGTITLAIATASGTQQGLLSSTDWTTFNNKQNALTNPVTGTGTTNYLPKFTGTSTIGNSIVQDSGGVLSVGGRLSASGNDFHSLIVAEGSAQLKLERTTTSTGLMYLGADNVGFKIFDSAFATRLTLTSSGNLGLGVTPSSWGSSRKVLEGSFGQAWFYHNASLETGLVSNAYHDGTNWIYSTLNAAYRYEIGNVGHGWYTAPASTGVIGFTKAMTLNASGNLSIGNTNDTYKLDVSGAGRFTGNLTASSGEFINGGQDGSLGSVVRISTTNAVAFSRNWAIVNTWDNYGDLTFRVSNAQGGNALSSGTSRMVILSTGNVGIGTTSPSQKLEVAGVIRGEAVNVYGSTDPASTSPYLFSPSLGALGFGGNGSERMRITSGGNVGIGTTSPQRPLHINGTEGAARFTSNASGNDGFEVGIGTSSQAFLWQTENAEMQFATNNTERLRITSGGEVLIAGTYNPFASANRGNITLNGTSGNVIGFANGSATRGFIFHDGTNLDISNTTSNSILFSTNGSEKMRITSGGAVGIKTTPSSGWGNTMAALQIGTGGVINNWTGANNNMGIGVNFYDNGAGSQLRLYSGGVSNISFNGDVITFSNAGSNSAGTTISYTERMRISSTGLATFTGDVKVKTLEVTNATTYGSSAGISTYMQITVNGNNYVIPLHGTP